MARRLDGQDGRHALQQRVKVHSAIANFGYTIEHDRYFRHVLCEILGLQTAAR